jgi:protease IV
MSLESDLLVDRRRLKRRLLFWRGFAAAAVIVAVLVAVGRSGAIGGPHVARLTVAGLITDDAKLTRAIVATADDPGVRALIVAIDSPGGSVSGGEALHDAIARVAAKKPVVAVMRGLAASAGYMIALPAARIYAREATVTGSIGVLMETGEVSGLLKTLGITAETLVSGPLKGQPSLTAPMTPQAREALQGLVMDMYDQFVGMVAEGRKMDAARVRELADGRAYTGRQALKLGLIDAIGGETEARTWLESDRGVSAKLPVRDLQQRTLAERALNASFGPTLDSLLKIFAFQGLRLDGPWAVWQPAG